MSKNKDAERFIKEIARRQGEYLSACRLLNESRDRRDPPEIHWQRLRDVCDRASTLHETMEKVVVLTNLPTADQNELWAKDLASSAFNILDAMPNLYRRLTREFKALSKSPPWPSSDAFFAMESAVTAYHPDQAESLRKRFAELHLPTRGFSHPAQMKKYSKSEWNTILITGVGLIVLMLAVAIFNQRFNNFNLWVFRVVTALAAAMLAGAALPGFLEVKGKIGQFIVRAAGSFAVFFLIFYVNPPALIVNSLQTAEHQSATPTPAATPTPSATEHH